MQNAPPIHSMIRQEEATEMDIPYNIQSTNVETGWEYFQPSELDAITSATQKSRTPLSTRGPRISIYTSNNCTTSCSQQLTRRKAKVSRARIPFRASSIIV